MNIEEKANDYIENEEEVISNTIQENKNPGSSNIFINMLKSKTGPGSIENYYIHPLNINNNKSIAQIIRGVTGMFGSLDFAIIDIIMGIFSMYTEKKKVVENEL
jgi:hypothetical protein